MKKHNLTEPNLKSLMSMLASGETGTRMKARKSLTSLGTPAVPSLTRALHNSKLEHLRWEAAKTLGAINDPKAIPSLVKALEDEDHDVAWLAAEALKKFKKAAWPKLMHALIKTKEDSIALRHGVHHVLKNQKEEGFNDLLSAIRNALKSNAAPERTAIAASEIIRRMELKP